MENEIKLLSVEIVHIVEDCYVCMQFNCLRVYRIDMMMLSLD